MQAVVRERPVGSLAWVGLGGNLGKPRRQFAVALGALLADARLSLVACSSLYRTEPWGCRDQPRFLNAVVALSGEIDPAALLAVLQRAERAAGRDRDGPRWGPRPIDLDLLAIDGIRLCTPELTLPHPRIAERAFVLVPMAELAPDLRLDEATTVGEALARLPPAERAGVQRLGPFRYPTARPPTAPRR